MFNTTHISLFAVLAFGALPACGGGDASSPAPATPAAVSAAAPAPGAGETTLAPAADPAPAAAPTADALAATPASGATNGKTQPDAKATSGSIVGQVDVTPAKLGKHVVVYLENAPAIGDKPTTATVDQRKMAFSPFLTVIPVGGKVIFRNDDPFPHNIFSPDGEKFDLGTMPHGGARVHVFKTAGTYTLLCNIHPGMLAYIDVVPSTHYVLASADGKYELKNVPPGTWKIAAWGPKLAAASQSVTMSGGQVTVNLSLHRGR